jgi:transposase-like protein
MLRCPRCGSTDLYQVLGGYAGTTYRCKRCGYTGSFVVESEEELPPPDEEKIDRAKTQLSIHSCVKISALLFLLLILQDYLVSLL